MKYKISAALSLLALSACATLPYRPAPQKLAPWTTSLRDQQADGPIVAVYKIGHHHLVFVGAEHENKDDSPTFRMIRDAYASFNFNTVIAEGFPTAWGANPARILDYVAKSKVGADGFVEGGETVPTVMGAQQQSARLLGGEPDDAEVKRLVADDGIADRDVLGFYVLRNVPQWISERELNDAADPRLRPLVEKALVRQRERLGTTASTLPDFVTWLNWYEATNGKPLTATFSTEEVGPLSNGPFATNKIAYAVSKARDAYLHRLIVEHLNGRKSVLVVFGGSHLMIHRPALDAVLGKPCYAGADLRRATVSCR